MWGSCLLDGRADEGRNPSGFGRPSRMADETNTDISSVWSFLFFGGSRMGAGSRFLKAGQVAQKFDSIFVHNYHRKISRNPLTNHHPYAIIDL